MKINRSKIFISKKVKNPYKFVRGLEKGKSFAGLYVICFGKNSIMEIYTSAEWQKNYRDSIIIGLAASKSDAFDAIRIMTEEFLKVSSDFSEFRGFLEGRFWG